MIERPILFGAPMVRAILEGRKTQTRRAVKPQFNRGPVDVVDGVPSWDAPTNYGGEVQMNTTRGKPCRYGVPGDRLWVRETWMVNPVRDFGPPLSPAHCVYRADGTTNGAPAYRWTPSIHMPRWASRINLEVTGARVERLQDISEEDAVAEGIERNDMLDPVGPCKWRVYGEEHTGTSSPRHSYESLWGSINGPESWAANPWVWVIEFREIR